MGFCEDQNDSEVLSLSHEKSLDHLQRVHDQIQQLRSAASPAKPPATETFTVTSHSQGQTLPSPVSPSSVSGPPVPPTSALLQSELAFRRKLESGTRTIRRCHDQGLMTQARACVPLPSLTHDAQCLFDVLSGAVPPAPVRGQNEEVNQGAVADGVVEGVAGMDLGTAQEAAATGDATVNARGAAAPDQAPAVNGLATKAEDPAVGLEDCLMLRLIRWFKRDFFQWVNKPNCEKCNEKTSHFGNDAPNDDEARWDAGVVELYRWVTNERVIVF